MSSLKRGILDVSLFTLDCIGVVSAGTDTIVVAVNMLVDVDGFSFDFVIMVAFLRKPE